MKKNTSKKTAKLKVCVIGPGIVGQATGKVLVKHGFHTEFLGGNGEKIKKLRKQGYITHERGGLMDGSYDFDVSFLTVPTPTIDGRINLDALMNASKDLGKRLGLNKKNSYHLVVVKSTVPPETTEKIVIPLIEKFSGKKVGRDFGVCMNPEYLREKTAYLDGLKPWAIVIGQYDKRSGDMLAFLYKKFTCPVFRCKLKDAEMQKYVHNLFNATKITFFNEMRAVGKKIDVDTQKVFAYTALSAEGMWNPNYGIRDFGPFDGSCLPKDTKAFAEWAKKNHFKVPLLESVIKVNESFEKAGSKRKRIGMKL